jgi:hypothetical protein
MWRWAFLLLFVAEVTAQNSTSFVIATKALPNATVNSPYTTTLKLLNGKGPYRWELTKGKLPPGILLQDNLGVLAGVPTQTGSFRFTLTVRDLGTNATLNREYTLDVVGPLLLQWVDPPKVTENSISGRVKVRNASTRAEVFDLTVIIVAVNEYGKATALGYQRFNLAQQVEQVIPFTSTLPNGHYTVHTDAIAEVPARRSIYRARMQTNTPLEINVNR